MPPSARAPDAEQRFDHLDRIGEHLALYAGYVGQVNALNAELSALRERGQASGRDAEFAGLPRRLTNHWVRLHQDGVPAGFKPLLAMDVWEHAFMRDCHATERGRYLDAFFRNVDWPVVERRLVEPRAIRPAAAA
jgi:hypothetical protein